MRCPVLIASATYLPRRTVAPSRTATFCRLLGAYPDGGKRGVLGCRAAALQWWSRSRAAPFAVDRRKLVVAEADLSTSPFSVTLTIDETPPDSLRRLLACNRQVKRGVVEAGLVGYRFNTIGVSDAISMGTDGMSFSLQSRDLIADSIETVRVLRSRPGPGSGPG